MRRANAVPLIVAVLATLSLISGCRGDSGQTQRDPSERGPYAVGRTRMTFEREANNGETRVLDTWIWYPASGDADAAVADPVRDGGPFPVVIFSHGSGGSPEKQSFFTEHLASWGFVVAAPPHPGNTTADCFPCGTDSIIKSAGQRPDDVTFVLDKLIALNGDAAQPLGAIIDPERAALAGHSFGGWTAIYSATSGRFDAVIAMAPGAPLLLVGRAKEIRIPVQIFESSKDQIVSAEGVRKLAAAVPEGTPLVYVTLPEGRHLAYIDRCFDCGGELGEQRAHELINAYGVAFLQRYVVGDERYAAYLEESTPPDALVGRSAVPQE